MAVSLHVRIELADGRRVYRPPLFTKNNKLRAEYALVDGIPEHHPEAVFVLRYTEGGKRVWKKIGRDPNKALAAKMKREHLEHGREIGQPVSYDIQPAPATSKRLITATIQRYLDDLSLISKPKTLNAYRGALNFFAQKVAPTTYFEDLTREDIKRYLLAIHALEISNRTIANRVGYVQTFLLEHQCDSLLSVKDKPKYTERDPNAYNQEMLQRLLAAADPEDRLVFQFFLATGAREQEVSYACWPDVDLVRGTFRVQEKEDLAWTLKDYEERTIPLPSALVAALKRRRQERPEDRLLFPTRAGKPEGHFLRRLKRAALRAGVNCGHCVNKKGLSCKQHPVCDAIELHRFRRTFATLHHQQGRPLKTLQRWLGHSEIQTTMRYLAGADDDTAEVRQGVNQVYESLYAPTLDASRCAASL